MGWVGSLYQKTPAHDSDTSLLFGLSDSNSQTLQLRHLKWWTPTRVWSKGRRHITETSARFTPLWSRRLWSDKANGRDVLGPLFSSDHPIDYGGLWGPGRLLHDGLLLLHGPHLLDLLVDRLLLLLLLSAGGGSQGEHSIGSSLLTALPCSQMVPFQQLPSTGPPLVQVAQPGKEEDQTKLANKVKKKRDSHD